MRFPKTDSGERILFVLTEEEAQPLAEEMLGRKLTVNELKQVQEGLEFGFKYWEEVMRSAIDEAI